MTSEGGREGGREKGREGEKEEGREGVLKHTLHTALIPQAAIYYDYLEECCSELDDESRLTLDELLHELCVANGGKGCKLDEGRVE